MDNSFNGGFQAPNPAYEIFGGFQAPNPKLKVYGGIKKRGRPKIKKNNETVKEITYEIKKELGHASYLHPKAIDSQLKKERAKFKSITNKKATAIKKKILNQGGSRTQANKEKSLFLKDMKEGLKRVIQEYILNAIKNYNNKL